jgi:hypothetical protein
MMRLQQIMQSENKVKSDSKSNSFSSSLQSLKSKSMQNQLNDTENIEILSEN